MRQRRLSRPLSALEAARQKAAQHWEAPAILLEVKFRARISVAFMQFKKPFILLTNLCIAGETRKPHVPGTGDETKGHGPRLTGRSPDRQSLCLPGRPICPKRPP